MLAKQPNGKYCRLSPITDSITYYDMTAEEYTELCKLEYGVIEGERIAERHLSKVHSFNQLLARLRNFNGEEKTNRILKEMGYDKEIKFDEDGFSIID